MLAILDRLLERGLLAEAHQAVLKRASGVWEILSERTLSRDAEGNQGMSELRRLETAGKLMQFLKAIKWTRTSRPQLAELEAPLRRLLEECLCKTRRTKRVAARCVIGSGEWTDERAVALDDVRIRVS